jgi:PAS domain S-box-containing protein
VNQLLAPSPTPHDVARLIERFDWAATPLGPRAHWPAQLETLLALMLAAPAPMVLLWGPQGTLLYNEGYATIAGSRHPDILGLPVLESWPEVRALNQRVMDTCFIAGNSLSLREEHIVLYRNGYAEDIWLDVDYSPVRAEGCIAGVFAIINEATTRVLSDWRRSEAENQLALAIAAGDLGTWDIDLVNDVKFWSDRTREMFGMSAGRAVAHEDFYANLHPEDRAAVTAALARAIDPAIRAPYDMEFRTIGAEDGVVRWLASKGRGYFAEDGTKLRFTGTVLEITARKNAERRQSCLVDLGDRLRTLDTTAEIAGAAAEILGKALDCARAGYAVIRGDIAFLEADWTDGAAISLVGPRLFASLGPEFCAPLLAGRTLVINDTQSDPLTLPSAPAFRAIGALSLINVPLLEAGQLTAILYVHAAAPRIWDAAEIQLVQDVADRTWEASGRARAAASLRKLNETLEQEVALRTAQRDRIWKLSSDVMLVTDHDGAIASVNPAWKTVFGWSEQDLLGSDLFGLAHPDDRARLRAAFCARGGGQAAKFECRLRKRDGGYLWLSWAAVPDETAIHAVGRDITAEREQAEALAAAEEALRQAQKMEAVGQLTGGIAHDFNNLLQGIVGSLDMVEKRFAEGRADSVEKFIAAARASANRAVALTHRLLAFSRRQPLDPKPVEANPLVQAMEDLLRRTLGERITLTVKLAPDLWRTLCDPHQLESAILNLAINARDAMPEGGALVLETENIVLDRVYAARTPEVRAGDYISVSVTDTGTGMPPSVVEQAFEPFFTTKPLGQGTGLGLSMIYGFTKQSEGHARIFSTLGRGTTVKIFLPRFDGELAPEESAPDAPLARPAHATVLVVEDEAVVRGLVLDVLEDLGLSALEAADGPAGLQILQSKHKIDLLITDIGLPGLNGRQMADAARLHRPGLKILFMTGYAETASISSGFLEPGMEMITKPFSIATLSERISAMIQNP